MEIKPREQIAITLFTGSILALFLFIGNQIENLLGKMMFISFMAIFIAISLKVILDRSTDLHILGDPLKKILNIK